MPLNTHTGQATDRPVSFDQSSPESLPASPVVEQPETGVFILPGGYVDGDGVLHSRVELKPLTGHDEEYLAAARMDDCSASVVTGLLGRCLQRVGTLERVTTSLVRNMLVGDRDYLMMKLREMNFGARVAAVIRCPNASCGEPMDVTFFLNDLQIERRSIPSRYFTMQLSRAAATVRDSREKEHPLVELRLPTGADQEALAEVFTVDEARAVNLLLARCIRRIGDLDQIDEAFVAGLPALTRREIEEQIERLSPQAAIELDGVCPECRRPFETLFDFMAFVFAEMRRNLRHLEREVHLLAWHYHWSERDILSMTHNKRRRYIELLREELERSY